jgi:hypothetical protein
MRRIKNERTKEDLPAARIHAARNYPLVAANESDAVNRGDHGKCDDRLLIGPIDFFHFFSATVRHNVPNREELSHRNG